MSWIWLMRSSKWHSSNAVIWNPRDRSVGRIPAELRSRSTADAASLCALLDEGRVYVAAAPEEHARFQARAAVVYCRLSMLEEARQAMSVAQAIGERLQAGPRL